MSDYVIGRQYEGRVTDINDSIINVKLDDSHNGRVFNWDDRAYLSRGDLISVEVRQNSDNEIILEFVSLIKNSNANGDIKPWNNWINIPTGHKQAITVLTALRTHTDSFRDELKAAQKEHAEKKEKNKSALEYMTGVIIKENESEKKILEKSYQKAIEATPKFANKHIRRIVDLWSSYANAVMRYGVGEYAVKESYKPVERKIIEVQNAVNAVLNARKTLYNCELAESDRNKNKKIDKAKQDKIDADSKADRNFKTRYNSICNHNSADIEMGFNRALIHAYQQKIK